MFPGYLIDLDPTFPILFSIPAPSIFFIYNRCLHLQFLSFFILSFFFLVCLFNIYIILFNCFLNYIISVMKARILHLSFIILSPSQVHRTSSINVCWINEWMDKWLPWAGHSWNSVWVNLTCLLRNLLREEPTNNMRQNISSGPFKYILLGRNL